MRAVARARATPESAAAQAEALAEIERAVAGRALKAGDRAPDFSLRSSPGGEEYRLSALLARGPVVLSFYRGQWCPYCNVELRIFQEAAETIRDLGAEVLFIGPETPENAARMVEKSGSAIPVLCDTDGKVMEVYGLVFEVPEIIRPMYQRFGFPDLNPATGWKLPLPATYIVAPDGIIAAGFAQADYSQRMDPADVMAVLHQVGARA